MAIGSWQLAYPSKLRATSNQIAGGASFQVSFTDREQPVASSQLPAASQQPAASCSPLIATNTKS